MEKESVRIPSHAEVLQRIQNETQRVRNRLSDDSDKSQVSSPTKSITREPSLQDLIIEPIEPSTSSYFEEPVPAQNQNMSDHLKSQHEAFKARYVNDDIGGAAFVSFVEDNLLTL
jgi:hypothetical protein